MFGACVGSIVFYVICGTHGIAHWSTALLKGILYGMLTFLVLADLAFYFIYAFICKRRRKKWLEKNPVKAETEEVEPEITEDDFVSVDEEADSLAE